MKNQLNLNGLWQMSSPQMGEKTIPVTLPGDNYTALYEAGIIPDPYFGKNEDLIQEYRKYTWIFSREFDVPEELLAFDSVILDAEKVDTLALFSLNGKKVFESGNMFRRTTLDVKKFLKPGKNTVSVKFKPVEAEGKKIRDTLPEEIFMNGCSKVSYLNLIRKVHCHGGWDWGITLCPCGIYEPLILTGINSCRIEHLYTEQNHSKNSVKLTAIAELYAEKSSRSSVVFKFNGEEKKVSVSLKPGNNTVQTVFDVKNPKLWWPAGYGEQALYDLTVTAAEDEKSIEVGLRTVEIINEPDQYGVSMGVRVNGVDIFCKGADWIPADAFPSRITPAAVEELLNSVVLANMNMVRVWGGGQYENDFFYQLCDRKGIMVWQDMMMACSLYPATDEFIADITAEVDFQIRRLRGHACIALWCGDNECLGATGWYRSENRVAYLVMYDRINRELQKAAAKADPERIFWPSSPCGGPGNFSDGWHDDSRGDMHYWEVWHGGKPFEAYYSKKPRFCSEFGYQSFPSFETVSGYCPEEQFNVFSPVMDHHQKCGLGNAPIIGMFGRYYRMPEDFRSFLYLSQVQQAEAIKTGVEYWRTLKPRCQGTLFWQLNDNWPVASWASIEYGGKWKQLQYHAKRFYAPVMATVFRDETREARLFVVSDVLEKLKAEVKVTCWSFAGKVLREFTFNSTLKANESKEIHVFKETELNGMKPGEYFIEVTCRAESPSGKVFEHQNFTWSAPLKVSPVEKAVLKTEVKEREGKITVKVTTDKPAFFVLLETPGIPGIFSDNSFALLPGKGRELVFTPKGKTTVKALEKALEITTLRDTYR